jgi:hypothetical protein
MKYIIKTKKKKMSDNKKKMSEVILTFHSFKSVKDHLQKSENAGLFHLFAEDIDAEGKKQFYLVNKQDVKNFINLETEGDHIVEKNLYEVILDDCPRYFYLDIDLKSDDPSFIDKEKIFFKKIKKTYEAYKSYHFQQGLYSSFLITSASNEKKISLHAIDRSLTFKNIEEQNKFITGLFEHFRNEKVPGVDESVYTSNRMMRCVYSTKFNQDRVLYPATWHADSVNTNDPEKFLIQDNTNHNLNTFIKPPQPPQPVSDVLEWTDGSDGSDSGIQIHHQQQNQNQQVKLSYDQYKLIFQLLNKKDPKYIEERDGWFESICIIADAVKKQHFNRQKGLELSKFVASMAFMNYDEPGTEKKYYEMLDKYSSDEPKTIGTIFHKIQKLCPEDEYNAFMVKIGLRTNKSDMEFDYTTKNDFSSFLDVIASKVWDLNELSTYIEANLCKYCVIVRNTGAPNIYVKRVDDETDDLSIVNGDFNFDITYNYVNHKQEKLLKSEKFFKWFERGNYVNFKSYKQLVFKPYGPYDFIKNDKSFNTWTGFKCDLVDKVDMDIVNPFINLVNHMWQSDYGTKFFLEYCAHLIQYPYEKVGIVPVLNGEGGSGKGTIGRILMGFFNNINTGECSDLEYIVGEKNSYTEDKVFVVIDESRQWSNDIERNMGKLKSLITDKHQTVRKMYQDPRNGLNVCDFLQLTNFSNCICFKDAGALRRWAFSEYIKRDNNIDYSLLNDIAGDVGKLSHIFTYLSKMRITIDFKKGEEVIPQTETLLKARLNSGGVVHNFINAIEEGEVVFYTGEVDTKGRISIQDLFYKYKHWCDEANEKVVKRRYLKDTFIEKGFKISNVKNRCKIQLEKYHQVKGNEEVEEEN